MYCIIGGITPPISNSNHRRNGVECLTSLPLWSQWNTRKFIFYSRRLCSGQLLSSEDKGRRFLCNFSNYLPKYSLSLPWS